MTSWTPTSPDSTRQEHAEERPEHRRDELDDDEGEDEEGDDAEPDEEAVGERVEDGGPSWGRVIGDNERDGEGGHEHDDGEDGLLAAGEAYLDDEKAALVFRRGCLARGWHAHRGSACFRSRTFFRTHRPRRLM